MIEKRLVNSVSSILESPLKTDAREPDSHIPPLPEAAHPSSAPRSGAPLDKADVEALIKKEYAGLRLLIFRRARDIDVASDLLNEAICTTWQKWLDGRIERPEQIAGYVFQVAMNLLRNHRRTMAERPNRRAEAKALDELPMDDSSERRGIEERITARVKLLLRSMGSQRDRTILVRFYLDEEDRGSICRDMGLTPAQFARVIHRARGRLRELLESEGFKGSDLYSLLLVM
jgi:RNA polymerase sigma-70 factor (ECF subfamily)